MILNEQQLTEVIKECGRVDSDVLARAIIHADNQMHTVQYLVRHSAEIMSYYSPEDRIAYDRWFHKMSDYQKYGVF